MCGRGAGASRRGTTWASIRCAKRQLGEHGGQGAGRFGARASRGFDPLREAPPAGARSRYDVWCDALVLTYTGDGCGIPMGASYVDVLRWLPQMRPYGGPADGEFRDMV